MTEAVERMLPLYEGKMGNQFDYRSPSFFGTGDTDIAPNLDHSAAAVVQPRYWVRESVTLDRLARRDWGTTSALLGFRRVARNTDERTVIAAMLPYGAASYGWILTAGPTADELAVLAAQYNSFVFDFVLRQFLSQPSIPQGTFEQLPTLAPTELARHDAWLGSAVDWVVEKVVALSANGHELAGLGQELRVEAPAWDAEERLIARIELDAAFFHFFQLPRGDVEYILDSFPIVKRKDEAAHGEYRTKRLILEIYDQMAGAIAASAAYVSPCDEELA